MHKQLKLPANGGYWIVCKTRKFYVQPVRDRNEREDDVAWKNGGLDGNGVKGKPADNGALLADDADAKLAALGCTRTWTLPVGMSPDRFIEWLVEQGDEPTIFEDTAR